MSALRRVAALAPAALLALVAGCGSAGLAERRGTPEARSAAPAAVPTDPSAPRGFVLEQAPARPTAAPSTTASTTTVPAPRRTTAAPPAPPPVDVPCATWSVPASGFEPDSADLPQPVVAVLDGIAAELRASRYHRIEVQGAADPRTAAVGNERLADERALAAIGRLVTGGLDPARIRVAPGGVAPEASMDDPSGWEAARRIEVRVYC